MTDSKADARVAMFVTADSEDLRINQPYTDIREWRDEPADPIRPIVEPQPGPGGGQRMTSRCQRRDRSCAFGPFQRARTRLCSTDCGVLLADIGGRAPTKAIFGSTLPGLPAVS